MKVFFIALAPSDPGLFLRGTSQSMSLAAVVIAIIVQTIIP